MSSTSAAGATDYGVQTASGGVRYVAGTAGSPLNVSLSTVCPRGSYPGDPTAITTAAGASAVSRSCVSCPVSTTTYTADSQSKSDCKCVELPALENLVWGGQRCL